VLKKRTETEHQVNDLNGSSLRATEGRAAISCLAVDCAKRDCHVAPLLAKTISPTFAQRGVFQQAPWSAFLGFFQCIATFGTDLINSKVHAGFTFSSLGA